MSRWQSAIGMEHAQVMDRSATHSLATTRVPEAGAYHGHKDMDPFTVRRDDSGPFNLQPVI